MKGLARRVYASVERLIDGFSDNNSDRNISSSQNSIIEFDDRKEWDHAWGSQRHRRIDTPVTIDVKSNLSKDTLSFGRVVSATISEDPAEFSDQVLRENDECPICGQTTIGMKRCAASLHPEFENGISNISFGVWAHVKCLDSCPDIDGPAPIPW